MSWYCGVCRLAHPAAAEDTAGGKPQCPTCGAPLVPFDEATQARRYADDPRRQHREDSRNARARDERERKPS